MSKYIIELDENAKEVVVVSLEDGDMWTETMEVEDLEQLNSDYINEHFGDLQDTAYQRGLDDAWEAAKKVVLNSDEGGLDIQELDEIFNCATIQQVFRRYTLSEVIAKLKAYEEKQEADDEIKVGDEVDWLGDCFIVTRIFQPRNGKEQCDGIDDDGCVYHDVLIKGLEKTGRHFDIASILEDMRND